ncbi:MAG: hypothetical protein SGILL_009282, partial [Bacillariaceae sp.]
MARNVENPFKERKVLWVQYVILSICLIFVLWIVSGVFQEPAHKKGGLNIRFSEKREQTYQYEGPTDDEEDFEQPEVGTLAPEDEEPDPSDAGDDGEAEEDPDEEDETFPQLTQDEYPAWLNDYYKKLSFPSHPDFEPKLTKRILEDSMTMGCNNMVANMRPEGNFNYQYDFVKKVLDDDDM